MSDTDMLCFHCVKNLKRDGESAREAFECAGCGAAAFGGTRVPKLNDLERQRCKNGLRDLIVKTIEACDENTPRSPEWGGSDT